MFHVLPFLHLIYYNCVKRINYFCSLRQHLPQLNLKNANNKELRKATASDLTKLYHFVPALGLKAAVEFITSESNLISNNNLDAISIVYHLTGLQPMFLVNS